MLVDENGRTLRDVAKDIVFKEYKLKPEEKTKQV